MNRKDAEALRAIRKSTLKSVKAKKNERLRQLKEQYEEQVREIKIQYDKNPERLRAKYAADDYARSERAKKHAARQIEKEQKMLANKSRLRKFSLTEEILSAIIHGLGAVLSIAATAILVWAAFRLAPENTRPVFISTFASTTGLMIVMYIMHTLHHAITAEDAKEVFERISHCFIYLVLGSAYTIFTLTTFQGKTAWILFGLVWALALIGIILSSVFGTKLYVASTIFYLLIGWAALVPIRQLYQNIPSLSFSRLIIGGLFYTVGYAFYLLRKIKYMHVLGDLFMLCGTLYFFFALFYMVA